MRPKRTDDKYWTGTRNFNHIQYESDLEDYIIYLENEIQKLRLSAVSGSVLEQIRQAFADYRIAEGCSCCRDMDAHTDAEKRLADLLKPEPYEDGSGWDWMEYRTDR